MYCKQCGAELKEGDTVCPSCGKQYEASAAQSGFEHKKFNIFSLLGFVFSLAGVIIGIFSIVFNASAWLFYSFVTIIVSGLVLGIIGTVKSKKYRSGKAFGITAIIISAVVLFLYFGFFLLIVIIFTSIGRGLQ